MKRDLDLKTQVRLLLLAIEDADVAAVQELLTDGCPVDHPDVKKHPLALALAGGNHAIVDVLLDSGAELPEGGEQQAIDAAARMGNLRVIEQALERNLIPKATLDLLLFDAAGKQRWPVALRLLQAGGDPLANMRMLGKLTSAFQLSANLGGEELAAAIVQRLTQEQKDRYLQEMVQEGSAPCVRELLAAGASAAQRGERGRTLLQMARTEEIRRMLRSHRTGMSIESAMESEAIDEPEPARSPKPLTL